MPEQRSKTRLRTLKSGLIVSDGGRAISCVVRNFSLSGACLEVSSVMRIPNAFTLRFEHDHVRRKCRVAWMKDNRIGVEFASLGPMMLDKPPDLFRLKAEACRQLADTG